MTEVQALELESLIKLDEVCKRNNLRYYVAYGTCIGAVRHQGFIPWDCDIDVLMHIDDVKRLEKLQDEFGDRFEIYSYRTNPDCKSISVKILDKEHPCNFIHGKDESPDRFYLCMDVYPFYNVPDSNMKFKIRILKSHIYKILVGGVPQNHGGVMKILSKLILFFHPEKRREKDIQRYERIMNYKGKSHRIADYYGLDISTFNAIAYESEWFQSPQEIEFEGHMFSAPTDIDHYLTKRYGDYLTPPPISTKENEVQIELIEEETNNG